MNDLEELEMALKASIAADEEAFKAELTVDNLQKEMLDNDLDNIFRERSAIGRYLLIHNVDFQIVKAVVCGKHWGIGPWFDKHGDPCIPTDLL